MVDILTDIHILEGVVYIKLRSDRQVIDSISRAYYDVVLDKYNISEEEFEVSMEYYTYHIEKMDKIYEDVITRLSVIESEETVKEPKE